MGWENSDFHRLALSLDPAIYLPLGLGDIVRRDGYSAVRPTVAGTPKWRGLECGPGYAFDSQADGVLILDAADCSETDVDALTFFVAGKFADQSLWGTDQYIVAKRTGAGVTYDFKLRTTGADDRLTITDSGNVDRDLTGVTVADAMTLGARFSDGNVPEFFKNGTTIGVGAAATDITAESRNIYLANYHNTNGPVKGGVSLVLIFPSLLIDEAIFDLSRLWCGLQGVSFRKRWQVQDRPRRDRNNPVIHLTGERNSAGALIDISGHGLNAQVYNAPFTTRSDPHGKVLSTFGAGTALAQVAVDVALYPDPWTVSCIFNMKSAGESNVGAVFYLTAGGGNAALYCGNAGATIMYYVVYYADGAAIWFFTVTPAKELHVTIRHLKADPANLPVIWVNGVDVLVTVGVPKAGALVTPPTTLSLLNYVAAGQSFDGELLDFRIYDGWLSDADVRAHYVEWARHSIELRDRFSRPETLAPSGVRAGPWEVYSGTFTWLDDGDNRKLKCISAFGAAWVYGQQADGAWYYRLTKNDDPGAIAHMLIATVGGQYNTVGQNGYVVYYNTDESILLGWVTNGVIIGWVFATAANVIVIGTEYEFFVTRTLAGLFTLWIRGGAYASWTALGGGTDVLYTSGRFFAPTLSIGDEISTLYFFEQGHTLLPPEIYPDVARCRLWNDQSVLNTTTISISCPAAGGFLRIYWGDSTFDEVVCDNTLNVYNHDYNVEGNYEIQILGTLDNINALSVHTQAWISGDIGDVLGGLSPALLVLAMYGTSITGDISALSRFTNATIMFLNDMAISGDISVLSPLVLMEHLRLDTTNVCGDLASIAPLTVLAQAYFDDSGVSTYTSTPLPGWAGNLISIDNLGWSPEDLDNFLIDLADGVGAVVTVNCLTGNGPRTAASDAAVAAIVAAGGSVI